MGITKTQLVNTVNRLKVYIDDCDKKNSIEELSAEDIAYDNSSSGLDAADVSTAIDMIYKLVDSAALKILNESMTKQPNQYLGTNASNEIGIYNFPLDKETKEYITQIVTLGVVKDQRISTDMISLSEPQKLIIQV